MLQPAHNGESRRTDFRIFQCQVQYLVEVLAVGMGVLPAGPRAHLVDGAVIVGSQERAGCYIEHVIPFGIQVQVFVDQFGRTFSQVLGDPVNVNIPEDGAGRFATIGTSEAIYVLESFVVRFLGGLVEVFRRSALDTSE